MILLSLGPIGCSRASRRERTCAVASAIVGGSKSESFLLLGDKEESAIVQLTYDLDGVPATDTCSGVLVAEGTVLSAAHCTHGLAVRSVSATLGRGGGQAISAGTAVTVHPTLDLLVASLDPVTLAGSGTIGLAGRTIAPGDLVEIAGIGFDGSGGAGTLQFAAEEVIDADGQFITVRGKGASGACFGDSGGPLLIRDTDGRVAVAGILSEGSASCVGSDRYTRLSGALDWVAAHVGSTPYSADCGRISRGGRCFNGVAVWCEAGRLSAADCGANACGWNEHVGGWRCMARSADPCEGVSDLGVCAGDVAVHCARGVLEQSPCYECSAACARSAASGVVGCVGVPAATGTGGVAENDSGDRSAQDSAGISYQDSEITDSGGTADSSVGAAGMDVTLTVDDSGPDARAADAAGEVNIGDANSAATMFLSNSLSGLVYRYSITPDDAPVLNGTISGLPEGGALGAGSAVGMALSPSGELFVADHSASTVYRFLSPLGTPVSNGTVALSAISHPINLAFVDQELWIANATATCTAAPASLVRVAFDSPGAASVAGTVSTGFIGADRGTLWVPETRDLYESQCTQKTIQHYRVAADFALTALDPITGTGVVNPQGMAKAPWGDLFVANSTNSDSDGSTETSVARFGVDTNGDATYFGTITGNGINSPSGLAFTPWGELFVVNAGTGTVSRFHFDSTHAAVANGTYALQGPTAGEQGGFLWILIVSGSSSAASDVDAGAFDAASE